MIVILDVAVIVMRIVMVDAQQAAVDLVKDVLIAVILVVPILVVAVALALLLLV